MSLYESFFIAQHVSNAITFIIRSRRLYVGVLHCNDRFLCISVLFVGECLFVGLLHFIYLFDKYRY